VIIGVFYLLVVRPQQKQRARHQQLMNELRPGRRVVTIGGIHGRVDSVGEDSFGLEVSEGVVLTFSRAALSRFEDEAEPQPLEESSEEPEDDEVMDVGEGEAADDEIDSADEADSDVASVTDDADAGGGEKEPS
jgi:preprotein translocase subunit YajC